MRNNIRRNAVSALIVACFLIVEACLLVSFASEIYLIRAENAWKKLRFDRAERAYLTAASLNPINARHLGSYADFLLRKSYYTGGDASLLERAEAFYQKTTRLDPASAEDAHTLGRIRISLFLMDSDSYRDRAGEALGDLKRAISIDPNGVNVSFLSSYSAVSVWEELSWEDREFFLERMKYALKYSPGYTQDAYRHILKKTGDFDLLVAVTPDNLASHEALYRFVQDNSLWKNRAEQEKNVLAYTRKESPAEYGRAILEKEDAIKKAGSLAPGSWQGMSRDRKHAFTSGDMYWPGMVLTPLDLPQGEVEIAVEARGTPAKNIYPYMIVELDGEKIGEVLIKGEKWEEYSFKAKSPGGRSVLGVIYDNDAVTPELGRDRNLYVRGVTVK